MLEQLLTLGNVSVTLNPIEGTEDTFGLVIMPKGKVPLTLTFCKGEESQVNDAIGEYVGLGQGIASASNITEVVAAPNPTSSKTAAQKSGANKAKSAPKPDSAKSDTPSASTSPSSQAQTDNEPEDSHKDLLDSLGL